MPTAATPPRPVRRSRSAAGPGPDNMSLLQGMIAGLEQTAPFALTAD